jgi:hypothetical protein
MTFGDDLADLFVEHYFTTGDAANADETYYGGPITGRVMMAALAYNAALRAIQPLDTADTQSHARQYPFYLTADPFDAERRIVAMIVNDRIRLRLATIQGASPFGAHVQVPAIVTQWLARNATGRAELGLPPTE